ncbi:MAG: hypothetical protein U1F57_01115 [bacterium]
MVPRIEASLSQLNTAVRSPAVGGPVSNNSEVLKKTIGEIPPEIVDPSHFPELAALATQYGLLSRIRRKLMTLSGRKGNVVLAKNTIGAADNKGLVYLGVDFLKENQHDTAVIAGVMAHEWGHLCSNMLKYGNFDHLTWDELFEIRRDEEAAADAFAGRNLPLMGYSVEPVIRFLLQGKDKLGSHKYYNPQMRAEIIRKAAQSTLARQSFSKRLFGSSVYANPYTSVLFVA